MSIVMNASKVKARENAVGGELCGMTAVPVTHSTHVEYIFKDCDIGHGLLPGEDYSVMFYVEGTSEAMGTISVLNVTIPLAPSNYFIGEIEASYGANTTHVVIQFTTLLSGVSFGAIVRAGTSVPSGTAVKNVDSPCKYGDVLVAARQPSTFVFDGVCNLLKNIEYEVYITVEDKNGRGDGSVHSPIALMLPSNSFIHPPRIIGPITVEGFLASFAPESTGVAYSVVVPQNISIAMNSSMVKAGLHGIGKYHNIR
jgi:hypothetical protein